MQSSVIFGSPGTQRSKTGRLFLRFWLSGKKQSVFLGRCNGLYG